MRVTPVAALLLAVSCLAAAPMPRLVKDSGGFQFLVDDQPSDSGNSNLQLERISN